MNKMMLILNWPIIGDEIISNIFIHLMCIEFIIELFKTNN